MLRGNSMGYMLHLILFLLFNYYHGRIGVNFDTYSDLIGWDESYWVEGSSCGWDSLFDLCFNTYLNLYPFYIYILRVVGFSFFDFTLLKCILYLFSVFYVTRTLKILKLPNVSIFKLFLLLNPYIILLHITALRDDIIIVFTLVCVAFLYRLQNKKNNVNISEFFLIALSVFMLFSLRLGFGAIALLSVLSTIIFRRKIRLHYRYFLFILGIIIFYFLAQPYAPTFDFSVFFSNLRKLILSPSPWNVINGKILILETDTSLLPIYSVIFPIFSFYVMLRLCVDLFSKYNCVCSSLRIHLYPLIFAISLLMPYALSPLDVAGPRQSLTSTLIFFYIFGARYVRFKLSWETYLWHSPDLVDMWYQSPRIKLMSSHKVGSR